MECIERIHGFICYMKTTLFNFILRVWDSVLFRGLLILIIIFLLLVDKWGISLFGTVIDYNSFGTVGDWFSNGATLITIIIAAMTIRNDKIAVEKEREFTLQMREQDLKEKENEVKMNEKKREQSVYVWLGGARDPITYNINKYWICVSNRSDIPVFEWTITDETNKTIVDSITHGPLFCDSESHIEVPSLSKNTKLVLYFTTYSGIKYRRYNEKIEEI